MKICMYNVTVAIKIGGIETYYWEVSRELKSLGHEVDIVTGNGSNIKYNDIKLSQFDFTPREKIFNLGNRFRKWGERISFFKNSYSYLKEQKYNVFLVHKPLDFFVCYFIKRISPKTKTIFVSGGEDFYGFDKYFSKYIDFMFAVSNDNAKKIKKRYKRDVKIIPNGVDINKFKPNETDKKNLRDKYSLQNKKILLSVGRIVGWKGFQLIIKSLIELKDFHYILIGDGEYIEELKKIAKELKLEKRVLFLGMIDNQELPKYLNIADIFVQPSIGHEAFGITIIEAMACGLPIVASRNGGIVDILKSSNSGYMFEINNTKQMITYIKNTYKEKDKFSNNSSQYVKDNFTWKLCVSKLLNKVKEIKNDS